MGYEPPPIHWDLLANAPGPTKKKPPIVPEDREPTRAGAHRHLTGARRKNMRKGRPQ